MFWNGAALAPKPANQFFWVLVTIFVLSLAAGALATGAALILRREVAPLRVFAAGRAAFAFRRVVLAAWGAADLRVAGLDAVRAVAVAGLAASAATAVTAFAASAEVSIAV